MAIRAGESLTSTLQIGTTVGSVGSITEVDRFVISDLVLVNSGTIVRTVNLYILQDDETISDARKILVNKRLGNGETYSSLEMIGQSIGNGGSIQAVVDAGTDVTISIVGTEFTT